jgi:hypothetical protein
MTKKTIKFNLKSFLLFSIFFIGMCISLMGTSTATSIYTTQNPQCSTLNESWGEVQLVSAGSVNDSENVAVASDGLNNTFIVWDEYNDSFSDKDIKIRMFNGNNDEWEETEVLSKGLDQDSKNPDIAIDNNNQVSVVWQDTFDNYSITTYPTIFYVNRSSDGTWTLPKNVTQTNTSNQINPSICFDENDTPHLTWSNRSLNLDEINLTYGMGVQPIEKIITNTTIDATPQILSDQDGTIHIIWRDNVLGGNGRIFHTSYNGTWNNVEQISDLGPLGDFNPASAIDSEGNLYVIWGAAFTFNHYLNYKVFNPSTGSWSSANTVGNSQIGYDPDIAIDDSDNIHVVWLNASTGNKDVYYKHFNAEESTWSSAQLVSTNSLSVSYNPLINIDSDGTINIIWIDETIDYLNSGSDKDIFMRRLTISESSGNGDKLIPGYNFYFLITVLGITSILLFKKYQS